jgi:hypothetical protein
MTEDDQTLLKIGIGTKEPVTLKPKKVLVERARLVPKKKDDKVVGELIVLTCRHPDRKEETIELSNVKTIGAGDKIKLSALWFNKDDDGNLAKKSTAAQLLRYYDVNNFGDLIGKEVETTVQSESNSFLCIKAY